MQIILASSNNHKRDELQRLLHQHTILLPGDVGAEFVCEETGNTFMENSMQKAEALWKSVKGKFPVLADDSGLIVPALPGLLGVKTARFGCENGKMLSSQEKNLLLLEKMSDFDEDKRKAFFVCSLTFFKDEWTLYNIQECCYGRILHQETGVHGFGYDPIFFSDEANSPMALLDEEIKNQYSHRGKAAKRLKSLIEE